MKAILAFVALCFSLIGALAQDIGFSPPVQATAPQVQNQAFAGWGDSLTLGQGSTAGNDYPSLIATGNILINGTFAVSTGWNLGTNTSISGNNLNFASASFSNAQYPMTLSPGVTYSITWSITAYTSGSVFPALFGNSSANGVSRSALGTYTDTIVAPAGVFEIRFNGATGNDTLSIGAVTVIPQPFNGWLVFNGGVGGQTSPQILTRIINDTSHLRWTSAFWMGKNNDGQIVQITTDTQTAVNRIAHNRYVVLSVTPSRAETNGTGPRSTLDLVNASLLAAFPNNYVDLYPYLCTDTGGVIPLALMSDASVHLNNAGYATVAAIVENKLATLPIYNPYPDLTPDPMIFTSLTGQLQNTVVTSNTIIVSGINSPTPISISGGLYSLNGGAFTSSPGTITNGGTLVLQVTTSGSVSTPVVATINVGTGSGTFTATTASTGNLLPNGTFGTGTGWVLGTNVNISGGTLNFASAAFSQAEGALTLTPGLTYRVRWTITSYTSGSMLAKLFGGSVNNGTVRNSAGTYVDDIVAPSGVFELRFSGLSGNDTMSIDNVTVVQLP